MTIMNTYHIPRAGRSQQEYFNYVGSLPWVFNGDPALSADISNECVSVDGSITGFEQIIVPPNAPNAVLSVLDFRNRFTMAEKVAIYTAAQASIEIQVWLADLAAAVEVNLSHMQTIQGVQALEQFGLIGAGRAAQILS